MRVSEYARHDAVGLRALIAAGEISAAEVEDAARAAVETANQTVNGLAFPLFSPALEHEADGPLGGVPFLLKDSGPMARGKPFSLGSRALAGLTASHDSDLMARFRAAGLATLGVTTVPELVISFATEAVKHGPTRNPWDPERGVGGSSGGAAALVAAGAVPMAHANDAAGSIRVPASCCGLVGLKPSRGRVPCGPDVGELAFGMAEEFALTRTVRDAAALLDAVCGPAPGDKHTAPPPAAPYAEQARRPAPPLRVAVATTAWSGAPVGAEVADAALATARLLAELGHQVAEASPRVEWGVVMRAATVEAAAIAAPLLLAPRTPPPAMLEAVSRRLLEQTRQMSALELMAGLHAQNRVSRSVGAFFADYDVLVTPTLAQLPAPHGTLRYDDPEHTVASWLEASFAYAPFTVVFNICGQPAISLPLAHSASGLPIGVQLVAGYGREDLLFRLAGTLEQALPWRDRRPPVWPTAAAAGGSAGA